MFSKVLSKIVLVNMINEHFHLQREDDDGSECGLPGRILTDNLKLGKLIAFYRRDVAFVKTDGHFVVVIVSCTMHNVATLVKEQYVTHILFIYLEEKKKVFVKRSL